MTQDPGPKLMSQRARKEEVEIIFFIAEARTTSGSQRPAPLLCLKISWCFPVEEAPAEAGQYGVHKHFPDQTESIMMYLFAYIVK